MPALIVANKMPALVFYFRGWLDFIAWFVLVNVSLFCALSGIIAAFIICAESTLIAARQLPVEMQKF
ncbi:hypothetical protein CWE07_05660 [Aliidiomarina maris]|uniref:Uncharacterized protein n=2 Tax=Aliidiomarina maris TaxID=531312 RepID=A0ABY0BSG6_9GAMM|nr:hypothetical protein CWE07_05660 [Aliidiomarina maris]